MPKPKKDTALALGLDAEKGGPVECLGMTFESDEARREHFLGILREKLKDPEFRQIEGFPIGEDEDILALSDPPYYTACPNPFIEDFIRHYGKPYDAETDDYHREPFAADVAIARHDHYTLAHTYHTKVSPLAIAQYVQHFTHPSDVVLDCFAGSGMTGLACAGADIERGSSGTYLGAANPRSCIAMDLCPAATHIADGYIREFSPRTMEDASRIAAAAAREAQRLFCVPHQGNTARGLAWKGKHSDSSATHPGSLEYLVWTEVLVCPSCSADVRFGEVAYDPERKLVNEQLICPQCRAVFEKRQSERRMETYLDPPTGRSAQRPLLVPLFTAYDFGGRRFYRRALPTDGSPSWSGDDALLPRPREVMHGERFSKDGLESVYGITHIHHFYTERNLQALGILRRWIIDAPYATQRLLWYLFTSIAVKSSNLMGYNADGVGRVMKGTLYQSSLVQESNPFWLLSISVADVARLAAAIHHDRRRVAISTQSASADNLPAESVDYVWVDPPFGKNLMYAELNQLWEWWLGVASADDDEAVIDPERGKDLLTYTRAMTDCFRAAHRALKPGRWITIEFHNSRNAVWNAIQEALAASGFVVADVRTLDKKLMTYKQSQQGLVKVDLVISAYKPNEGLEQRFRLEAGAEDGVWDFVRTHLRHLPTFVSSDGQAEVIAERQDYLLFDRMVAFHVQRGVTVPLSAAEFYAGLRQRFPERDGMFFLPDQVTGYDKKRLSVSEFVQLEFRLTDEASAVRWLRWTLKDKPQTFQQLQPEFMQEVGGWLKHEKTLELSELLDENFLRYDGAGEVPSQIHAYLSSNYHDLRSLPNDDPDLIAKAKNRWYVPDPSKEADLEKIRHRALIREFREYQEAKGKLKVVRTEALRAGFKQCWQESDYGTIVEMARRLPEAVIQEDPALLMYYDNALQRTEG